MSPKTETETSGNLWPCPNNCLSWCRASDLSKPQPNHHPRCEHYSASLMDVWSVRIPGEEHGCTTHCEADAHAMAMEDPHAPLEVVKMKMHREVYENLPEFPGF